jgi:hypothetical protein
MGPQLHACDLDASAAGDRQFCLRGGAVVCEQRRRMVDRAAPIGAVVPFTFIGIMPTNNRLLSRSLDHSSHEARQLLVRWGHLHAVRTVLSLGATALYTWLAIRAA